MRFHVKKYLVSICRSGRSGAGRSTLPPWHRLFTRKFRHHYIISNIYNYKIINLRPVQFFSQRAVNIAYTALPWTLHQIQVPPPLQLLTSADSKIRMATMQMARKYQTVRSQASSVFCDRTRINSLTGGEEPKAKKGFWRRLWSCFSNLTIAA